ncbi:MAG: cyclase family protein [Crocinitomicaceae bacterium]|nr:cyclase family protein [Crocinitomicaceae bacterium]
MNLYLNENEFIRTDKPLDISIPIHNKENPVLAWYCDPIKIEPVMNDQFVGDVNLGGSVNFRNIFINPHAHGTHTECVGHISKEYYSINQHLKEFHFEALLISVDPETIYNEEFKAEDQVVTPDCIRQAIREFESQIPNAKALVIRTTPNGDFKQSKNYSGTNPIYYSKEAIELINELHFDHLIVDLPSIDREQDGGELTGHHTFWNYPSNPQLHKTITELVYIPDAIKDGRYLCNIQITALENDASPSKIVLYKIENH